MNIKKLQEKIDQAIALLSDHDDKKEQDRYINLQNKIIESQEYIDSGNHISDLSLEFYNELKKCMKEFEENRFIFIIFLIILCGLLFVGVFFVTYSHMYDYWHPKPGGNINPPHLTKTHKTTTITTNKVSETTITTTKKVSSQTTQVTFPSEEEELTPFVYLTFDNSNLIDLNNLYPMLDNDGLKTKPTKWSLTSKLSNSSKNYILTYYIDFIDNFGDINSNNYIFEDSRLDINKLKYQLLIKNKGRVVYNSEVQDMYDYPESEEGIRPIISGQTMNNDESLDFELRMWLDSATGNDQQGKKYRFKINVTYDFKFID